MKQIDLKSFKRKESDFEHETRVTTSIDITGSQKKFLEENGLNLSKIVRTVLKGMMPKP